MFIKRTFYIDQIKKYLDKPVIKVLTGMRRVGKSTILKTLRDELIQKNIPQENIIFINKESLEFDFIKDYISLNNYVIEKLPENNSPKYLFVDEIQEIAEWEKAITSFLSDGLADIIITGSNAHLLASELATLISGRYIEIPVYPLTFNEFLEFKKNKEDIDRIFREYITFGGLPGIHMFDSHEEIYNYLNSILNTVLFKDVIRRNSIRDVQLLEKLVLYLMDNCGNITTAKNISNYFKSQKVSVSVDKIQNYIRFLSDAFLFWRIPRYDIKGKKHFEYFDKIYIGDVGLRNGFIGYKDKEISGILENIVLLELKKRGYKVSIGVLGTNEIDFIAEKYDEKIYIQVCLALTEEKTIKREFGNLSKIKDNYKKIVLSMDKFFPKDYNGIEHKYIPDFLLE